MASGDDPRMGSRISWVVPMAPLILGGCALDLRGLEPDEAGHAPPTSPGSTGTASDGSSSASADVVVEARLPEDAPSGSADVSADEGNATSDAAGARGDEERSIDATPSDVGSDASTCVLPLGATICCGSVACADDKVPCDSPGQCAVCEATCVDPVKPVCCPTGTLTATCVAKPNEC
jgi:hypothetical protein